MSKETATPTPPPVLWAQNKEEIFLTFSVESKDPIIKIENDSVYFKGNNVPDNKEHEVTISLHAQVLPDKSVFVNKGRCIEMVLRKDKKDAKFWPSLTRNKKPHYLKIDFNKWRDEDDDEEEVAGIGDSEFEKMLKSMGAGLNTGAGDKPYKPSFDDLETDSDDENLPDLE